MRRRPWLAAVATLLAGCLLRTVDPARFFRPGSVMLDSAAGNEVVPPPAGGKAVRLRGVRSQPFLREPIVWRRSAVEYGLYQQRRWTDLPADYVAHALGARLASTPGLRLTDDPRAATLHVELLAFDEVLAPAHLADVGVAAVLEDPVRGRVFERAFQRQVAIADARPESMAKAMGEALDEVVGQIADAVKLAIPADPAGHIRD